MRVIALTRRILRQFHGDKRTIALILVAPVIILTLLSQVFNGAKYHPHIATVDVPEEMVTELKAQKAEVQALTAEEARAAIEANRVDAVISYTDEELKIVLEGSDPAIVSAVMLTMKEVSSALNPLAAAEPDVQWLHGKKDMAPFHNFGPVLIGFLAFFFTFLVSGVSLVRERTTGTLERMMISPLQRWEVVAGYVAAFGLVMVAQSTVLVTFSTKVLNMVLLGSFGWLLVITLLLSASALTLSMFLSAYARTEFQVVQFIPIVLLPQILFSGLFPLESMAPALRNIGRAFPLTYGARAMRQVMLRGGGWADIRMDLAVLTAFTVFFLVANVFALKRYRSL